MKNKILSLILSFTLVLSVFVSFSVFFATPAAAVSYTADSSWYSASKSVLEINDIPDFVAFMNKLDELGSGDNGAKLGAEGNLAAISWSGKMPFEGQTIVLNTDINLNPGITFSSTGPNNTAAFKFSRTARQIGFGGIFDGQGHTISGLYIDAQKGGAGSIFGVAGAATKRTNVVVRNLQIKNSLIANTNMGAATIFSSVAFNSTALIQNVYSEAFVRCTATATSTDSKLKATVSGVNMGGLCATVGGTLTIDSSVYAGTFSTASGGGHKKYVGGLVGNITNKELNDGNTYTARLNVENSAYYGYYSGNGVYLGKISGNQTYGSIVTVNNSIFLGTMKSTASVTLGSGATSAASTYYVGRLIGDATSGFTLTGKGNVASPSLKGSTSVTANYNTTSTSGFTNSITVTAKTDANLKGASINLNSVLSGLGRYWVANGTRAGYPVPTSFVLLYSTESLKHDYINPLTVTPYTLLEQLGPKKENGGIYTEASYRAYSDAYASIVNSVFKSGADLTAINIASLKSAAEAKLQTPVQARRAELKDSLGAKISNSGGIYTEDSYSAYTSAYDAIIASLNNADTVTALDAINVASLKTQAEAKLVTVADVVAAKKAELIAEFGEKKTNSGTYTDDSYSAYLNAFDTVCASINGLSTLEELNEIDVSALKGEVESKLVKLGTVGEADVPSQNTPGADIPNIDTDENDTDGNDTENIADSTDALESNAVEAKRGGCGSSIALSVVVAVGVLGTALVVKRKEN
ncbi:MAG: hypothetical protein IJD73_04880 [Clostridia bacterium]|nr:hypothetical protein [Clostridia bacterium]